MQWNFTLGLLPVCSSFFDPVRYCHSSDPLGNQTEAMAAMTETLRNVVVIGGSYVGLVRTTSLNL